MRPITLIRLTSLLLVLISASSTTYGQFQGPRAPDGVITVKEIIDNASRLDRTDALVKVQGYIVKQLNTDTYLFKDETGTVKVEIDKYRLPHSPFDEKTEIIIIGEVDHDLFEPVEIEAKEVTLTPPNN